METPPSGRNVANTPPRMIFGGVLTIATNRSANGFGYGLI
jgi:hypothetical protein